MGEKKKINVHPKKMSEAEEIAENQNSFSNLTYIFEHHSEEFIKFDFVAFLSYEDRTNLRATCKLIEKSIPMPNWTYYKHPGSPYDTEARLEQATGAVETRGPGRHGDSSAFEEELRSNVITVIPAHKAFAVIKSNGNAFSWGYPDSGGDFSSVSSELQSDVVEICATHHAFSALKSTGKVITWGYPFNHALSAYFSFSRIPEDLQSGVSKLVSNTLAFAALKEDGQVI